MNPNRLQSLYHEAWRSSGDSLMLALLGLVLLAMLAPLDTSYRSRQYLDFALDRAQYLINRLEGTVEQWPERFDSCDAELKEKLRVRAQTSSLANDYAYVSDATGFCRVADNNDVTPFDVQSLLTHPMYNGVYLMSKASLHGELFLFAIELKPGHYLVGNTYRRTVLDIMVPWDLSPFGGQGALRYHEATILSFGQDAPPAGGQFHHRYRQQKGDLEAEMILPADELWDSFVGWLKKLVLPWAVLCVAIPVLWRRKRSLKGLYLNDIELCYKRGEIYPAYQPIVDARSKAVVGYEQLARWDHPSQGKVPPDLFVSLLERHQRLDGLTTHLLNHSLPSLAPGQYVSINLTLDQLARDDLERWLEPAMRAKGLNPSQVVLEITEREPLNADRTLHRLRRLQQRGFRLALDDFGTGHNDLGFLGRFQPDLIKVDKSYTHAIGTGSLKATMLEAIIKMAMEARIPLVIEGVETEEQERYLCRRGVDLLQGYRYGKPHPVA
ncbi:EAL domain-containing protein [Ferrimonas balearica]|uniref:EAL domain-containing protein n=1 Tax=Ferrimonas balearica TaxID=44012 RepID=UPI001C997EBA|nr:EAL domain-containing protein [Ferrimonas balearica]MBY5990922.1 EAL domain-containing protein [Ferrimonas balearica]